MSDTSHTRSRRKRSDQDGSRPGIWMPLYVDDYFRDTGHLTAAEHGAYLLLIMQAWRRDGVLPADDDRLCKLAGMSIREWRKCRDSVMAFFTEEDGTYRHKRIDAELEKTRQIITQRQAAAHRRWGDEGQESASACTAQVPVTCSPHSPVTCSPQPELSGSPQPVDISPKYNDFNGSVDANACSPHMQMQCGSACEMHAGVHANDMREACQSQSQSQKEEKTSLRDVQKNPTTRSKPRLRIPDDWEPAEAGLAYAEARGVPLSEIDKFRNYHLARDNRMADWNAAWRTWSDNHRKFSLSNGSSRGSFQKQQSKLDWVGGDPAYPQPTMRPQYEIEGYAE